MTKVTIDRELLERIRNLLYTIAHRQDDYGVEAECIGSFLPAILAAPSQPEEGLEIRALEHNGITVSYRLASPHELRNGTPLIRLSDAQRAIAELRDRLDVMTQCADNYSRMFEESEEECERLRVKLMTIASAEPGRHNIEWAKAMAATGNNEAYAKWREAFDQRDKLADILRDLVPGCKWRFMRPRIDAALAEIDHGNE